MEETRSDAPAIGRRLAELIFRSGMQKKQVAARAGKTPQWLSEVLAGRSRVYAEARSFTCNSSSGIRPWR
jgi:transcriptional regulator with XRE-family HTH domain